MLIKRAAGADPSGPVLRSQIARLQILLPEFDVPVRLELVSDNATQVQIQRVGTFGTFSKREIELKPGKYTVVGTRPGFRDDAQGCHDCAGSGRADHQRELRRTDIGLLEKIVCDDFSRRYTVPGCQKAWLLPA